MDQEEKFSLALVEIMSPDAKTRNEAAIALMDFGDPKAVAPLVAAIEVAENRKARGTLIYALSSFDCSSRFPQIFRWAVEGGFEASHEAMSILRKQGWTPNEAEREACLIMLSRAENETDLDEDLRDELSSFLA